MIDWLIKDATIVDGTGGPPYLGDIAVSGDRILGVEKRETSDVKCLIEAHGKIAAPGFIDMHSHSDVLLLNGSSIGHKICQGVTTELIGQDGMSAAPLTETSIRPLSRMIEPFAGRLEREWPSWDVEHYLQALTGKTSQINVASLVGHCNLRLATMGDKFALPARKELQQMGETLAISLEQGAIGLSIGLIYPPSSYSDENELIYLGKVVKGFDGLLVAHMRDEEAKIFQALEEMISVGRESGCKIHISHLKCMGKSNWEKMPMVLEALEEAVNEGIDLSFDQYPYPASCTSLSVLLPGWAMEGGWTRFQKRLSEPEVEGKILVEIRKAIENRGGAGSITIASVQSSKNGGSVGKTIEQISGERGTSSDRIVLEILAEEELQVIAIYHAMSEKDVEQAMTHFLHTVGSDGILGDFPHPRAYGTFPRVIRHYSQERRLFTLEEAVRKMTSAPANRLGVRGRGQIAPGYHADLILFSLENFRDTATFENPKQFARGLDWVFVNGIPVIEEGQLQERFPGRVLKRS